MSDTEIQESHNAEGAEKRARTVTGRVVSNKMDKSIVVLVEHEGIVVCGVVIIVI